MLSYNSSECTFCWVTLMKLMVDLFCYEGILIKNAFSMQGKFAKLTSNSNDEDEVRINDVNIVYKPPQSVAVCEVQK